MDNQQKRPTESEIGWLAGILEGEGCFSLTKTNRNSLSPRVQITNTNPKIVSKSQRIIKDLGLACYVYSRMPKTGKLVMRVEIAGIKRVQRFLIAMLPYIECRKWQAEAVLNFVNSRLSRQSHSPLTSYERSLLVALKNDDDPLEFSEAIRFTSGEGILPFEEMVQA